MVIFQKKQRFFLVVSIQVGIITYLAIKLILNQYDQTVLSINAIKRVDYEFDDSVRSGYFDFKPNNTFFMSLLGENTVNYYSTNADGLAETKDFQIYKQKNIFRIISLGDSFVFGLHVPQNKNYSKILEYRLNKECKKYEKYEVINFGVPGYDFRYSADKLINKGTKYTPDQIIWWVNDNDIDTFDPEVKKKVDERMITEKIDANTKTGKERYEAIYNEERDELKEMYGSDYFSKRIKNTLYDVDSHTQNINKLFIWDKDTNNQFKLLLNTMTDLKNISILENSPNLKSDQSLTIPNDFHPSASGHELIADNLFNYFVPYCW